MSTAIDIERNDEVVIVTLPDDEAIVIGEDEVVIVVAPDDEAIVTELNDEVVVVTLSDDEAIVIQAPPLLEIIQTLESGPPGPPGANGQPGPPGADGMDGIATVLVSDTEPASPVDGVLWYESDTGRIFLRYFDGNSTQWIEVAGPEGAQGPAGPPGVNGIDGVATVLVSDTEPASPTDGVLWYESDTSRLFLRYFDGNSVQWIEMVGPPGPQGAQGPQGEQGEPGDPGDPGGPGGGGVAIIVSDTPPATPVDGQLWYESDSGNTFIWYFDGNSSQWVQQSTPLGTQGPQGDQGLTGDTGPPGADSTVPGPMGPPGDPGQPGTTFVSDAPPISPIDGQLWYDSDSGNTFIWYFDGNSYQWVQHSTPIGTQGPQGPQGLTGDTGPAGPASTEPGPAGSPGDPGEPGEPGPPGADSTVPGPAGPPGPPGAVIASDTPPATPIDGQLWYHSASGNTFIWYYDGNSHQWVQHSTPIGTQGPQGVQGLTGATGPAGPASTEAGPKGETGDTGPAGPPGADSTVEGPKGDPGDKGEPGPPGMAIASASDAPPTFPVDGQLWYETATGKTFIYYFDGNSRQWVQQSTPQGTHGPQGDQGLTGATGPPGAASTVPGPKGDPGDTGPIGPIGPPGPPGSPGGVASVQKDDLSTYTASGFFYTDTATIAEGWPQDYVSGWYNTLTASAFPNYSMQIASGFWGSDLFFRNTGNQGLAPWYQIYHSGTGAIIPASKLVGTDIQTVGQITQGTWEGGYIYATGDVISYKADAGLAAESTSGNCYLWFWHQDNPVNQKYFEIASFSDGIKFEFAPDSYLAGQNTWLHATRNAGTYTTNYVNFPNGNVGIGMVPSAKLSVAGNVNCSGSLAFGNGIIPVNKDDIKTHTPAGIYLTAQASEANGWPVGSSLYWGLLSWGWYNDGQNYSSQLACSIFDDNLFFRSTKNVTPALGNTWKLVHTDGNFLIKSDGVITGRLIQNINGFGDVTKQNIVTRTDSGFFEGTGPVTAADGWPVDDPQYWHLLSTTHQNLSVYYSLQIASSMIDVNQLYVRVTAGSGTAAWRRLHHDGNTPSMATGGVMGGALFLSYAAPKLYLDKTASGQSSSIHGRKGSSERWQLMLGDTAAESGTNNINGSDFRLSAFDDGGSAPVASPLVIYRATGQALISEKLLVDPANGGLSRLSAGGIPVQGTNTNNDAATGYVGEYLSSSVLVGTPVALTTATYTNLTSLSLTAGDWDVWVNAAFDPAGTTNIKTCLVNVATASAVGNGTPGWHTMNCWDATTGIVIGSNTHSVLVGPIRISLANAAIYYANCHSVFSVSTMAVFGIMHARRVR